MTASRQPGEFATEPLNIIGGFNQQRFRQFGCEDTANWYIVNGDYVKGDPQKGYSTKRSNGLFPVMGRSHINYLGANQLIFGAQPRAIFKSITYGYIVVGNTIFRIDTQYNQVAISGSQLATSSGPMYFTFLVFNNIVFSCFVDSQHVYVYREDTGIFYTITDPNCPGGTGSGTTPGFIAAFGNRITVSVANSSQFFLSQINLGGLSFNPATCFTVAGSAVFAQEAGIIGQMGVLNNTLYMFCNYTTGIWANQPAVFSGTGVLFPWKKNTNLDYNFGIANPTTLDIDFGRMVWLARNSDGLLQFMHTKGDVPEVISSKAVDVLLQRYTNLLGNSNPFLSPNSNGFLFIYEDTIFYRMSGGDYTGNGILDQQQNGNSIEFNFDVEEWHRCIELNGERNRIQDHIYFNYKHLVTVIGENTIYNMSGQYYYNEIRNSAQTNPQAMDAYLAYPFRYERVTPIISEPDYAEFETEYAEIDFVFGDSNINYSTSPFLNAIFLIDEEALAGQPQYIIGEQPGSDGQPVFVLADNSNTPSLLDTTYNYLFNPHIELLFSDDGGISFNSADVREFSQMGVNQWKMRWYQLGCSRNRVYKLICVSAVPIVVLGAVMNVRRVSGGAN